MEQAALGVVGVEFSIGVPFSASPGWTWSCADAVDADRHDGEQDEREQHVGGDPQAAERQRPPAAREPDAGRHRDGDGQREEALPVVRVDQTRARIPALEEGSPSSFSLSRSDATTSSSRSARSSGGTSASSRSSCAR
jgi:hypothetical protein